jgi:hypothetical protein
MRKSKLPVKNIKEFKPSFSEKHNVDFLLARCVSRYNYEYLKLTYTNGDPERNYYIHKFKHIEGIEIIWNYPNNIVPLWKEIFNGMVF